MQTASLLQYPNAMFEDSGDARTEQGQQSGRIRIAWLDTYKN